MTMRVTLPVIFLSFWLAVPALRAQQPKLDSVTLVRASKPILRAPELLGVLAATGIGIALDKTIRKQLHDTTGEFSHTASQVGNAIGGPLVYPVLLVAALGGKAFGSNGLYGVSSRAFKSVAVAGASAMALKVMIGRRRPSDTEDNLTFEPVSFHDNAFPSGHSAVAFALATSFSREMKGRWNDVLFFSLASLTAYSRMHDNRHWFSDVVFGAGIGVLSARFVHRREAKLLVGKSSVGLSLEF